MDILAIAILIGILGFVYKQGKKDGGKGGFRAGWRRGRRRAHRPTRHRHRQP